MQCLQVTKDLYKRARKLRRASDAIRPLLEGAHEDLAYIEQVGGDADPLDCHLSSLLARKLRRASGQSGPCLRERVRILHT